MILINQSQYNYMKQLQYAVTEQVAKNNPEGFTIDINTGETVSSGYAIAYKETQNSFGTEGLMKAVNHAIEHAGYVGGWFNKENGKYYFDSIMIETDRDEAMRKGKEQEQIAIFHLDTFEEITL